MLTDDDRAAIDALARQFGVEARASEGAVVFGVESGAEFVPRLFAELELPIRSVAVSRPTLDDVFMSYTGTTIRDAEEDAAKSGNRRGAADDRWRSQYDGDHRPTPGDRRHPPPPEIVRVSVPQRSLRSELRAIKIVWKRELIRYFSDRLRIVTALVQPLLFLFVLGAGLEQLSSASTDGVAYKTIIYPGILAISVLFTAMFSAATIVWDREYGFLREMMVAPVRRSSIVIGKCLGGASVAGIQGRDRAVPGRRRRCSLQPRDARRAADPAAAAGVRDHRVRGDDRDPDQADAVVHGHHADGDDAD